MLGKVKKIAMMAFMLAAGFGMNTAMAANATSPAGEYLDASDGLDYSLGNDTVIIDGTATSDTNYLYSNGTTDADWASADMLINSGKELYVGNAPGQANKPLNVSVNSVTMQDSSSKLTLDHSVDGIGSTFHIKNFNAAGTVDILDSGTGKAQNKLIADTFVGGNNGALAVNVGTDSLFQVNNSSTLVDTAINAFGGTFTSGTVGSNYTDTLSNSSVNVSGAKGLAVFNNKLNTSGYSSLTASGGAQLTFNETVTMSDGDEVVLAGGSYADFSGINGAVNLGQGKLVSKATLTRAAGSGTVNKTIVGREGWVVSRDGGIEVDNSTLLLVTNKDDATGTGNLTVTVKEALDLNNGTLGVYDLTLTNGVKGDLFGVANGDLNANSLNVQEGAIVNGSAGVNTTIARNTRIDGTYNVAGTGNNFQGDVYISSKGILGIANGDTGATITTGTDTAAANITVANGGTLGSAGKNLTINTLNDVKNNITFNGSGAANTVLGNVAARNSKLVVSNDLVVDGSLTGDTYNQTSGTASGTKGSHVYALNEKATSLISGGNSNFLLDGTFMGGLNVTKGATLLGTGNTIDAGGNTSALLNVDSTSKIDLSDNSMTINDFNTVKLDGQLVLGVTGGEMNTLNLGNGVNLSANLDKSVTFGDSFLQYYQDNGDFTGSREIIDGGTINGTKEGSWTTSSIFGDFTFEYNKAGQEGLYLTQYDHSDVSDLRNVGDRLTDQYGSSISGNITQNVSDVAKNILDGTQGIASNGSYAGDMNYAVFESIAKGLSTWSFTRDGKTYEGTIGKGILATMNGSTAAAPIYVAQDSIRDIQNTVTSRLEAFRAIRECVVNECFASGTALGSADILNERYLNRVWVGALGNWQKANARKGYDGWKYNGAGGIVGYDRAFGAAILGASFAFLDGNYHDKTFDWNDSKIRQHNVNLYGTYNASSGFFATVMGGYNYSRNKLRYGGDGFNASETYRTHTWYASGKLGYDIMPCDNFSITPSLGVNYFYSRSGSHNINVNEDALTNLGRMKNHHVEIPLEVQVAYEIPFSEKAGLTLMANGGYTYNVSDKGVRGDVFSGLGLDSLDNSVSSSAQAVGRKLGHHAWNAGAGVKFRYDRWDIGVKYDYYGRNEYNSHRVMGTIGYSF